MAKRELAVVLACYVVSVYPALSEPIDCDRLSHSKIPYQLQLNGAQAAGDAAISQIYRADRLFSTAYRVLTNGKVSKAVLQGGLIKEVQGPDGKKSTFAWSVPTDRFYFDAYKSIERTQPSKQVVRIENMPDEDLSVGPCVFHVSHFKAIYEGSATGLVETEHWYSKDLLTSLRLSLKMRDKKGKDTVSMHEAVGIQTSFVPAQ